MGRELESCRPFAISRKGRQTIEQSQTPQLLKNHLKRGFAQNYILQRQKPNSALRKVAQVRLTNSIEVTAYTWYWS